MQEILQTPDEKSVISSRGWKVEVLSVSALAYAEGDKTIVLELEDCPNERGELEWRVYTPAQWRWEEPHFAGPLPPQKISEILNRVELAFWKLDLAIKEIV